MAMAMAMGMGMGMGMGMAVGKVRRSDGALVKCRHISW